MHRDRNNNSWSELKAKRNRDEFDGTPPAKSADAIHGDMVSSSHDGRKEKIDRAARQLDSVKNMFKDMVDHDRKQNKRR